MQLRLVTWNILQGGGSRIDAICEQLLALEPDILMLQEFRNGRTLSVLVDTLDQMGLDHRYLPNTPASKNAIAVAARLPLEVHPWALDLDQTHLLNVDLGIRSEDDAYGGKVEITLADSEDTQSAADDSAPSKVRLLVAHLPHKKAQRAYLEAMLDDKRLLDKYSMIIGDLNCGIPFEDSDTKTFENTHLFQSLLESGWIDVWRKRNIKKKEFSWVSAKGNGFRYDHCLCTPRLNQKVVDVQYDHDVRNRGISDHSAMTVTLDI